MARYCRYEEQELNSLIRQYEDLSYKALYEAEKATRNQVANNYKNLVLIQINMMLQELDTII